MRRIPAPFLFALAAVMLAAPLSPVQAQQFGALSGPSLSIDMTPAHPEPGDTVRLTASSDSADLGSSNLIWSVNGKPLTDGIGATTVAIVVGKLGSETDVRVRADTDAGPVSSTIAIVPAQVDLVFDSNAYVPPLYAGRALPSPASTLRVEAIPWLKRTNGSLIPANQLTYTWRRNGSLISGASGRGRSAVSVPAPALFGTDTISVEVASADKTIVGATSISLPSVEPVLRLYEDHPVFGLLYRHAFGTTIQADDTEMTFAAVPYFAYAKDPGDTRLSYVWHVNGKTIPADATQPDEVTVSAGKGGTVASIELEVTNAADLYMDSTGQWRAVFLRGSGGDTQSNPFRSSTH